MTTLLEARYRAVLRLLPPYYRRAREDEMVETYLWDLDRDTQDQSRPTWGEVAGVVALAVRSRVGAPGAPHPYALLGSAARHFALFAVLLQAAAALVDRVLALTWSSTRGAAEWRLFVSGFTGHGPSSGAVEVAQWTLPLLWTVAYFALLRDRRRPARVASCLAALPTLWPLLGPLVSDSLPPEPAFATASALLAWLSVLALSVAHHRDAPPASLPAGTPGLVLLACCVVMGASVVLLPDGVDSAWAPVTCFLVGALAWLMWPARRASGPEAGHAGGALALAALGLLLLALRVCAVYPWRDAGLPAVFLGGAVGQAAVLTLLTATLCVLGGRELTRRDT
ncbi:hypothetical protein [Streptomyces griseus]|uniref:hypothetical protein n=1 Tax=Streptomyces griseus TaxID=1911 RepID=UPI00056A31CD|nr:hypothetical protein [Streptomyces griseus]